MKFGNWEIAREIKFPNKNVRKSEKFIYFAGDGIFALRKKIGFYKAGLQPKIFLRALNVLKMHQKG